MKLAVFPTSIETARALILRLVELMNEEPDRIFNIAVSGGNTPALMFDLWANEYLDITPWNRMKIYWVDERCVPPEDSDSNYGMMRNLLLGIAPIPYENVFRIRGEAKPVKEAVDRHLPGAGKTKKVALVDCRRKLLTILNAMLRKNEE